LLKHLSVQRVLLQYEPTGRHPFGDVFKVLVDLRSWVEEASRASGYRERSTASRTMLSLDSYPTDARIKTNASPAKRSNRPM